MKKVIYEPDLVLESKDKRNDDRLEITIYPKYVEIRAIVDNCGESWHITKEEFRRIGGAK